MTPLAKKVFELFGKPELAAEEKQSQAIPADVVRAQIRPFLPRPIGQEADLDPWAVWEPLFTWLLEHHPDRLSAICEAEGVIKTLERAGLQAGAEYDLACAELYWRFEEARRVMMHQVVRVWMQ